ncbi:hypothetical protein [Pantoea stewartii]|uniref:Uncharacterized protein n=1 Tax=Pantoea stewartii TaxID=66269 RepID=A0AB34VN04_9GAMM|nr:hypothetical protein [Pantoea stewartii]KTS74249.1 hypothetical protein RSA30_06340 [Pantoea stewartii]KTT00954.1 hypothetical protein RSA13_00585 [Pantoea stewartii]KTT08471.1 hypothetical protein RSA36_05630 [Pantoea stewartii]
MPDEVIEDSTVTTAVPTPANISTNKTDAILAKVKELLKVAGHDVEALYEDVVALAKKLA